MCDVVEGNETRGIRTRKKKSNEEAAAFVWTTNMNKQPFCLPLFVAIIHGLCLPCVTRTIGMIDAAAARISGLVVRPFSIDSFCNHVVSESPVATPPPRRMDLFIK